MSSSADNPDLPQDASTVHAAQGKGPSGCPTVGETTGPGPPGASTYLGKGSGRRVEPPDELLHHPRYELLEQVGAGSMGVVYRARHRFMDRIVALKVVRSALLPGPELAARFRREVRAAACLLHPNIVAAFDAETSGNVHFLVLEYVPGQNLADLIRVQGPLPVDRACDYARQAALGLQQAHLQGTVHRDIKPHNLLLAAPTAAGDREVVKILDFGLARFIQEVHPQCAEGPPSAYNPADRAPEEEATAIGTSPGMLMGTVNYMAPEQAAAPHLADIRADVYSLGCTLYHFLAGRPPFPEGTTADKLRAHRSASPPPLTALRSDVPIELDRVVQRMLAKAPDQRYPTPIEVAEALAPFATGSSPAPAADAVPPPGGQARPRRSRLPAGIVAVVLASLVAVGIYQGFFAPHRLPGPGGDNSAAPLVSEAAIVLEGHSGPVWAIAYAANGNLLLSGSADGTVRAWDLAGGKEPRVFRGHRDLVRSVAISSDGKLALSGSKDSTVRLWDMETGEQRHCWREHGKTVTSVAFSPDGRHALSGSEDGAIYLWEVAAGAVVRRFQRPAECLAFAPDGQHFVSGWWDKKLYLWSVECGRELRTLQGHKGGVKSAAFSPDGGRIVSASEDRHLIVWDVQKGEAVLRWWAHKGHIWGVVFSADGQRILSAGWDRTARLWEAASGGELQRFAPDAEEILCAAISPDGQWGACGSADGLIRLWRLPP